MEEEQETSQEYVEVVSDYGCFRVNPRTMEPISADYREATGLHDPQCWSQITHGQWLDRLDRQGNEAKWTNPHALERLRIAKKVARRQDAWVRLRRMQEKKTGK